MRIRTSLLVAALAVSAAIALQAKDKEEKADVVVSAGFGTGNSYKKMRSAQRVAYASGVFDGLLCAPLLGAPGNEMTWITAFSRGKTNTQMEAILTKYIDGHPESWDKPLNILAYEAFHEAAQKTQSHWKD